MSNIAKLKKKAAEFEQKRQPDKALAAYIELLQEYEASPEEMDVGLFNRVGDMLLKQGNVADAVDYYERAVDHYSDGGFFNNAIALCNKILRQSPGRASVYYKLGKISAQKGFTADAKRNFLEFADRMQKGGKIDEAFRALKEFADLCPDQDDIRLMLADQLQRAGKSNEAVQQLQQLYQRYLAEGRKGEGEATAERIRSIDPTAEVRAGHTPLGTKAQELVFLDLNEAPRPARGTPWRQVALPQAPAPPMAEPPTEMERAADVEPTSANGTVSPDDLEASPLDGVTRATDLAGDADAPIDEAAPVAGLVGTSFDARTADAVPGTLIDLEPTALAGPEEESSAAERLLEGGGELGLMPPNAASPTAGLPLMGLDDEEVPTDAEPRMSTPAGESNVGRASTLLAARSVEVLQAVVHGAPDDWGALRELGEAMLEAGNREGGLRAFETAMKGYETDGNLDAAASMADEIVRADPGSVKHYQKRVEYAFRSNDKRRLVDAYLELADALFRTEQPDKARVIYHRVLELAPDNLRAQAALSAFAEEQAALTPTASAAVLPGGPRSVTPGDGSFVNLGDLMREDERPKDTRMIVAEEEPTGDEEADFADMLKKFKQGVADNVEEEDYQSHYDLGIAFKEMGLLDESIAEFQKALRSPENRVRTYEAIGQCFMEKGQYQMAATLLGRGLHEKGMTDDKLVGVLYLLGRACEALGKPGDALGYYQRIFVVDIQFSDVADRMNAIDQSGS
ncbi:MAG: tetratricopeptide repeat protein [Gemmatimonadaceae bacterium]|nr:tetratricopeptide repeat protein [Gemmatimonadaceae bacterium]